MKRRILSILLILALALSLLPFGVFAEESESSSQPVDEALLRSAENARPVTDPEAVAELLAMREKAGGSRSAASRAMRGTYSPYYCNLRYIAQCLQSSGAYSSGSYAWGDIFEEGGVEYFVSIIYTPSDHELLFAADATGSFGTLYDFLIYDLSNGTLEDGTVLYYWDTGSTTYSGYSYLDPSDFTEDSSLLVYYYDLPSSMGQDFADAVVGLLNIGLICWNNFTGTYCEMTMGDIGFTSYYAPTDCIAPTHDFRVASSSGNITKYVCKLCGFTYTSYYLPTDLPFADVEYSDYFYEPVKWAVNNGITNGTDYYTFAPEEPCTRGQIVTFLWRTAGCPSPSSYYNPFKDVKPSDYYYDAVLWAVEKGVTNGVDYGRFGPNESCTRGQVVTFLYRYCGCPGIQASASFVDIYPWEYYFDAVLWAATLGITNGSGYNTFSPDESCTRGQIVTFLYRAYPAF